MIEIVGYCIALLIGVSLGLIGGGGSILTIPVLVYLFNMDPLDATGYSLFIVGCSSLLGAFMKFRKQEIDLKAAGYFGLTSIVTVILVRKYLLPIIPNDLLSVGDFMITKSMATLLLFGIVMIIASINMINRKANQLNEPKKLNANAALIRGLEVGILTGLIGAGGGFVIIPVLLFSFQLPMKKAIGTSLLIISANSLFGFVGDLFINRFDWPLLLSITVISCSGILIGNWLSNSISGNKLKRGFGFFVLSVGCFIIIHEIIKLH